MNVDLLIRTSRGTGSCRPDPRIRPDLSGAVPGPCRESQASFPSRESPPRSSPERHVDSARQNHCGQGRFGSLSAGAQKPGWRHFPPFCPPRSKGFLCGSEQMLVPSGSYVARKHTVSQQVADIQDALRALGYEVGRRSGRLTDETRAAIRSYESDHGLLASGQPSAELLQYMRRSVETAPQAPVAADANTIAGIQGELRLRGYPIPRVTGQMDSQTRQAIREYQQGQGVAVTGAPSAALLAELRAASGEPVPTAGLTREQRAAAQRALNARGYEAGPPDGVLGPRSRNAIRTFQADNDITPDGELTFRTMALLGLGVTADAVEPPAVEIRPYRVRVRDDFADGDHTRNPAWHIASGRFEVRGEGLNSTMIPPSERAEDMGRQILSDLLQQQLGFTLPGQETAALAYLPTRIGSEFRITTVVSGSAEAHSHLDLGPYRGDRLNHGYRLNYRTSQTEPLQLIVVNESGISVIASARLPLDSGGPHRLVWERDAEGRMTVTRNDEILIDVVDRTANDGFDGFSLINAGGDWTLHEVTVEDRG